MGKDLVFSIIGLGAGGQAWAADLLARGYTVRAFDVDSDKVSTIARTGITAEGMLSIHVGPPTICDTLPSAIEGSDIILVVTTAGAHGEVARQCARTLGPGQKIVLSPGGTGGVLEFAAALSRYGLDLGLGGVAVCEAEALVYACNSPSPGRVRILGKKQDVGVASMPTCAAIDLVEVLNDAVGHCFRAVDSVLETGLSNVNYIFHVPGMMLNAGWVEAGRFHFYSQGISASVARAIEALDAERLAVAEAYGVKTVGLADWLRVTYGVIGHSLYDAIQKNPVFQPVLAPQTLSHRYVTEDVPAGLVPLVALGEAAGLEMSVSRLFVDLAGILLQMDFWKEGRSSEKMGIAGLTAKDIKELARNA